MKALTIEELKSLEVGDWVWVVYSKKGESCYEKIAGIDKTRVLFYGNDLSTTFSTYGTKWLAYKNKEQTETKGEIVEVVEYNGYAPYLARDNICGQPLLIVPISEERNKELKEQGVEDTDLCVFLE